MMQPLEDRVVLGTVTISRVYHLCWSTILSLFMFLNINHYSKSRCSNNKGTWQNWQDDSNTYNNATKDSMGCDCLWDLSMAQTATMVEKVT